MSTTKIVLTAAATALVASIGFAGGAVAYPDKPVTYYIPFGPGGESDITARFQQPFFKAKFGQDFVVTYKPGGGGAVGWSQLNRMKADGHTIMGTNLPHIVVKPLQKNVGFKTKDIANVYMFHYTPDALVVANESPFKTLQDLLDYAKANPGKTTLSGSGKGTANHVAQLRFDKMAGVKTTYIAFKGTGASVTALLGEQVKAQWGYSTVPKKYETTRMLAVAMAERHPAFPDVPTFKELGYDLVSGAYRGIAVPKKTPEAIKIKLAGMIDEINNDPAFQKKMLDNGFALSFVKYGAEMDAFMAEKAAVYEKAAREGGIIK